MSSQKSDTLGTGFSILLEENEDLDVGMLAEPVTTDARVDDGASAAPAPPAPEPACGTIVVEDVELLLAFTEESMDHLESIEKKILALEGTGDPALLDEVFRCMHTMKGNSSFFGLVPMNQLSHRLESILSAVRDGELSISEQMVDVLLEGADMLRRMVEEVVSSLQSTPIVDGGAEIPGLTVDVAPILTQVEGLLNGDEALTNATEVDETHDEEDMSSLITEEMVEKFVGETNDLLDVAEKSILELETHPGDMTAVDEAFRSVHTIKGNAGFMGYPDLEKICMGMESVLDTVRTGERPAEARVVTTLLGTVDTMRRLFSETPAAVEERSEEAADPRPIGEMLVDMGATTPEEVSRALDLQDKRVGEILVAEGKVSPETLDTALKAQGRTSEQESGGTAGGPTRRDIRVDMTKLDKLFDLMGELITAEAMVVNNEEVERLEIESFDRATIYLSKITREMQEITLSVRMIPLEGLFSKMRRLVRDLSRKFGKTVDLAVSGQDTEMDRNVIEEISDPLVHIIRNAIDHGVEDGQTRTAGGKESTGHIRLSAKYEGNEIWISVADDGAGLNRDRIIAKAMERGVLPGPPENMADEDVWELVLQPGFSTAAQVSEISGRGVGMDVVKKNVEKLRGKVDINSTPGQGTEMTLKIPLTLAIIDGITVKAGGVLYALPLGDILEFHKATPNQITRTDGQGEVVKLRDDVMPIIKLDRFFHASTESTSSVDGILLIVQGHGRKAGVLVDEILGYRQIVVKALPEYLAGMRAISGCSVLGNGDVSLIVDSGALIKNELG